MTDTVRLGEDDWERLAAVRLRALREAPHAFASSLAREEGFRESHWRMRLRSSPWWVAVTEDVDAGLVCVIQEPGATDDERHLVSLWVDPAHRGRGVGRALLDVAATWSAADGASVLTAWSVEGNDEATVFYRARGWTATDVTVRMPRDPSVVERRWTLPIGTPNR